MADRCLARLRGDSSGLGEHLGWDQRQVA